MICIVSGLDVAVYTRDKRSRPWTGVVVAIEDDSHFKIQWYEPGKKKGQFLLAMKDGVPHCSVLDNDSVILWAFSSKISDVEFFVKPAIMEQIMSSYKFHDRCYI